MAYTERLTREEAVSVAIAVLTAEIQHYGLPPETKAKLAEEVLSLVAQLRTGMLILGRDDPDEQK